MDLEGKISIVTGGGHGLGAALCRAFAAAGSTVVVADLDGAAATSVADEIGGMGVRTDVAAEADIVAVVATAEKQFGRIDVIMSNAGVGGGTHPFTDDAVWQRLWRVNVMSNVYAARHALPGMLRRGSGYLLCTASSNGITTSTGDMAYAATKHAQVAIAEWLAMVYGSRGIRSSAFCPRWMWTEMTRASDGATDPAMLMAQVGAVTADEAAAIVVRGIEQEHFLITTADDTIRDLWHKAKDFEGWIRQLQGWHDELQPWVGPDSPPEG